MFGMKNLTLKQLRFIQAIESFKKISLAADHLNLTAPAITLQLKQVEEQTGLILFERKPTGMKITSTGRAFIEAAGAIDRVMIELEDRISAIKGAKTGHIRLGVVSTAKYFAPFLVAAFKRSNPEVIIDLQVGNRDATIAKLKNSEADIFLMGRPPTDIATNAAIFGDNPLIIVASPRHPLARQRDISKERIAEENFLIREKGSGTRISLEIYLGEIPGKLDTLGHEMDSNETIKQSVMAGLGVGFISAHTVAEEISSGRLVPLDVEGIPIKRQWFSVTRTDRSISPAMQRFQDFLVSEGSRYLPHYSRLYTRSSDGVFSPSKASKTP